MKTLGNTYWQILLWGLLICISIAITKVSYVVLKTEPLVLGPLKLYQGLGKPSGGDLIDVAKSGPARYHNGFERYRGNWTVVVFTTLTLSQGLMERGIWEKYPINHTTLSNALRYLSYNLRPHGVKIVLVQLDPGDPGDFYQEALRVTGYGKDGKKIIEKPWDYHFIAATREQNHPRYFSHYYYPLRVWLEKEWFRPYAKAAGWAYTGHEGPTQEFTTITKIPLYAIVDPSGNLRWINTGVDMSRIVSTLYRELGLKEITPKKGLHVLSPLEPIEHRTFGRLRFNDEQPKGESRHAAVFAGETCLVCATKLFSAVAYVGLGIGGYDGWPAREALALQEREPLKVPLRTTPTLPLEWLTTYSPYRKFYPEIEKNL